ncbi:MAG: dinitrogenase iron-molybdenum cofactor biosynthesis protein [candidate division Zixibacteria bacterium HGW-Zixibacteria-1]|nr:MAG: dinitrogenase iron-molybdenum cofactor biosynthesis protein [candidate division Zixibacteria bacterium HGW-Zixibacteria-1]
MKIAISSQGKDLSSNVDPRFGRARYFIIYDTESGGFEAIDNNQNINAAQGAGIQAAQIVARQNVAVVISGNLGPKAFGTLAAAGIRAALRADGSVAQAIALFQSGQLKPADSANVEGHWM